MIQKTKATRLITLFLLLIGCHQKLPNQNNSKHSEFLMFECKEDINLLTYVVFEVYGKQSNFEKLIERDTFKVAPVLMKSNHDTTWHFSFQSQFANFDTLADFNYKLYLPQYHQVIEYSSFKIFKEQVHSGTFSKMDSFTVNGLPMKNEGSNNVIDIHFKKRQ